DPSAQQLLTQFIEKTLSQFRDLSVSFSMLLPDEETLLANRITAFGIWCEGFVTGLTFEGNYFKLPDSPEIEEMMSDLREMIRIDEEVDEAQEQEKAFFELQEYVKVAVLLLQEEFSESRSKINTVTELLH